MKLSVLLSLFFITSKADDIGFTASDVDACESLECLSDIVSKGNEISKKNFSEIFMKNYF